MTCWEMRVSDSIPFYVPQANYEFEWQQMRKVICSVRVVNP